MNKLLKGIVILTIFALILMCSKVYAATPTLEQIVNTFNNCSTVKEYASYGSVYNASSNGNKFTIAVTANNTTSNVEYTLENTILSANFSGNDAFTGLFVTMILVDSIGQLHGYSDGELFTTLNSDKISSYSIENEGFEAKEISDNNYQIKIDISKKIPLIDVSDAYIEISDLQDLKQYIAGDGSAEKSKGNIWFNKSGYHGENTLLIAEKEGLTNNTYKSILSIIEVMFESSKVSDYFSSNYSGISVGNKEFTGFKIEINPTKTEFEEKLIPSDNGYKFARITIDKNLVNSSIKDLNNEENDEQNKELDNKSDPKLTKKDTTTITARKLPQAGISMNIVFVILVITIITIVFYKKYNNCKDIK